MSVTPVSRCGSSPHTRGAPPAPEEMDESDGIIPAYAGSTTVAQSASGHGTDHPRIRGEHDHALFFAGWRRGSSPHTRGARLRKESVLRPRGIIPAYAGSTRDFQGGFADGAGSSPHTRGAPTASRSPSGAGRIIPAYAGSTAPKPMAPAARPDHPRIRGEHVSIQRPKDGGRGSSPHTRGAQK